jgi:hypothetical protein
MRVTEYRITRREPFVALLRFSWIAIDRGALCAKIKSNSSAGMFRAFPG